jgi:hypothetical protein
MTELLQELTEALDAWKAVSPAVGQVREVKDFRLPDEEWTSAMCVVILVIDGEVASVRQRRTGGEASGR